ncbi:MAG TPA: amidase family protein, partial [Nitrospira sp.]|nr:amidase family protein [Nitrospira sp.]
MALTVLHKMTLAELQRKFTAGDVSATEIVRAYFLRVAHVEPKVNAYLTQCKEAAVAQAERLDQSLKGWRKTTPLMAMPLAVKDNICTEGVRTTCASRMLESFVPP